MTLFFLIKFFAAVIIVVGLSVLSEKVSPKIAGIIAGCPTGTAISLFYFGYEISPDFASKSARYNMLGVLSMLSFSYVYYLVSSRCFLSGGLFKINSHKYEKFLKIILSVLTSVIAFLFLAYLIQKTELNLFLNIFFPLSGITFFIFLFRKIPDTVIENRIKLSFKIICIRGLFAASIILFVTEVAKFLSPQWAGVLSSFPTTLLPLLLIIHFSYLDKNVHTIIKNVPLGAYSLVLYSFLVSYSYPKIGVTYGTISSMAISLLYLLAQNKFFNTLSLRK